MKKLTILFATMACMAMSLTSCQKEENDGYIRFRATVEPATDGKYYFKPELGSLGSMTWGYDPIYGDAPDFPIYIHSQTIFDSGNAPTGIYVLDLDNSDDLNATFMWAEDYSGVTEGTAGIHFTNDHAGTFWAFANGYDDAWTNSSLRHTDDLGTYMVADFNSPKYIDAHDDIGALQWTDIEMVARGSGNDFSNLHFKQLYGMLKINLTLPADDDNEDINAQYTVNHLQIYYADDATNKIPLSGELGINFDADGNPYTFISPVNGDILYNYYCDFTFYYNGYDWEQHPNPQTFAIPLFPNNYNRLVFEFKFDGPEGEYSAIKYMRPNQTLNIERAKIYTLNLTLTEDDIRLDAEQPVK